MRCLLCAAAYLIALGLPSSAQNALPPTEDNVEITFSNEAADVFIISTYGDAKECTTRTQLMPEVLPREKRVITASAKNELAFTLTAARGWATSACFPTFSFQPEKGKRYVVHFGTDKAACYWSVSEVSQKDGTVTETRIPARKREWRRAFFNSGAWCRPIGSEGG